MINKHNKFEILSILLRKIVMNKFRNQLFICFKARNETLNLDKLNFIKYDTENKTFESFTIINNIKLYYLLLLLNSLIIELNYSYRYY